MKNKTLVIAIFISSILLSIGFFFYRDFFRQAESLGFLGLFIVNFVSSAGFFISGPAFLTIIAGGGIYSPSLVALIAALGACLGDMLGFIFGYSGRKLAKKRLEKHKIIKSLEKQFDKHGGIIIFLLALIPNPFFDGIGILAGVVNYPPSKFFIIMLVGRLIRYWLLAQFGSKFN